MKTLSVAGEMRSPLTLENTCTCVGSISSRTLSPRCGGSPAAVDPGDDLLSGDQLVLGDTGQGAVDERVGPELLHDADIDRDAVVALGFSFSSKFSGRIPSTRFFSSGALARVSRGTGTV